MRWGHRKRQESNPGMYTASNGLKVAPAKNTYVKVMRKVAANRGVEKLATNFVGKHGEQRIKKESAAIREYNARAKDDLKAKKKEYKNDVKTLQKTLGVGDVNLYNDQGLMIGRVNSTTVAYNELSTRKGKEYADRALEKAKNKRYANIVGSTAVLLGASVALQMWADS